MSNPLVSVIVVNYNAGEYLDRCLTALLGQSFRDFEALVVDNASTDGSFERVRAAVSDPRFRFIPFGENLGFAAANNRAAPEAKGEWLALLNPDAFAEPEWLAALLQATRRYPDVEMFGSTQIDAQDPTRLDGAGDHYLAIGIPWRGGHGHPLTSLPNEREVFGPCAAACLYRAITFRVHGGFDESFFGYCEDVDFAFRVRLSGGRCVQVKEAVVRHVGGASATMRSSFARYHGVRNMIWLFLKDMPAPLLWPLLPLHGAALLALLVRDALNGDPAPVWRGIRDALCGLPSVWRRRRTLQAKRAAPVSVIRRALVWDPGSFFRGEAV